jgi:Peptidase C13 family
MVIDLHLTPSDWVALQQVLTQRVRLQVGRFRLWAVVVVPMASAALLVGFQGEPRGSVGLMGFAAGTLAMACAALWSSRLFRRQLMPDADGQVLGGLRLELSAEGIRTVRRAAVALTEWPALKGITRTDTHVFLWVDSVAAIIVPLRDVPQGAEALLEAIGGFTGPMPCVTTGIGRPFSSTTLRADDSPAAPDGLDPAARTPGFLPTLARRLTWRAVTPGATRVASSDSMIFACACTALAIWLGYDRYAAGRNAEWYLGSGMTGLAWYAIGAVALAWVLYRASLGAAPFRLLLASIVASLPLLLALGVAILLWVPPHRHAAAYAIPAVAALFYLKRSLTVAGDRAHSALLAGMLFIACFTAATNVAWVHPRFWIPTEPDDKRGARWAESERMLFAQADRIDAAAARMTPARDHWPDLFFVGFAGEAEEKVFAEEIKLAAHVVTERYGAAGRSLLLVNDKRDHDRWPIATVGGLRRALARVGARMNREDDVLFLMLSSHGSDDPVLSVSNGDWPLEQLDGRTLRAALDESGIHWRVIVISACHSGAFIPPLADDGTIVFAAAAKERTSFGCDDTADVTYFGQALMHDALPRADSLEDAFLRAKEIVAERERRENLPGSEPQAYYGSAIRSYWKQVEAARPRAGTDRAARAH